MDYRLEYETVKKDGKEYVDLFLVIGDKRFLISPVSKNIRVRALFYGCVKRLAL